MNPRVARASIVSLLFLAKIFGRIVGSAARAQTRLLSKAQALGWIPSDLEAFKLMRRQQQLFQYDMAKKRMRLQKNQPKETKL